MESVEQLIIAGVDDHGQPPWLDALNQPANKLCRTYSPRECGDRDLGRQFFQ